MRNFRDVERSFGNIGPWTDAAMRDLGKANTGPCDMGTKNFAKIW